VNVSFRHPSTQPRWPQCCNFFAYRS
jgi:hypothetical protein